MNTDSQQKIKLLIFTPTLECGGSEKYVSILCNNISEEKFDVTLMALNDAHPFYEIKNTVEVIDLKVKRARNSLFAIKKIIKQKKPDIIYTVSNHLNLMIAMFRWALPRVKVIVARESSIVSINNRRTQFPALYNRLVKKYYRKLDHIISQSDFMQQDLVSNFKFPNNKITVIHNPVEDVQAVVAPQKNKLITVARLSEEKGIDRLIRSVAQLSIPFQYHIIGEGNKRMDLQNLINELQLQDKVFLDGEKINPYHNMDDAALMLSGSHYEGFPNALLEAGARGIPVVAFDAPGGTKEIITDGENGFLVKDNDEKAFGDAIERALSFNFDRNEIIDRTKKRYSINAIVAETEGLFLRSLQATTLKINS